MAEQLGNLQDMRSQLEGQGLRHERDIHSLRTQMEVLAAKSEEPSILHNQLLDKTHFLRQEVDHLSTAFNAHRQEMQDSRQQIQDITTRGLHLEEKSKAHYKKMKHSSEASIKTLRREMEGLSLSIQEQSKLKDQHLQDKTGEMASQFSRQISELNDTVTQVSADANKACRRLSTDLTALGARLSSVNSEMETTSSRLSALDTRSREEFKLVNYEKRVLDERLTSQLSELERRLSDQNSAYNQYRIHKDSQDVQFQERIQEFLKDAEERINEGFDDMKTDLDAHIQSLADNVQVKLKTQEEGFNSRFREQTKQISDVVQQQQQELIKNRNDILAERDRISNLEEQFQEAQELFASKLKESLQHIMTTLETKLNVTEHERVTSQLDGRLLRLQSDLSQDKKENVEWRREAQKEMHSKLSGIQEEIDDLLDEVKGKSGQDMMQLELFTEELSQTLNSTSALHSSLCEYTKILR